MLQLALVFAIKAFYSRIGTSNFLKIAFAPIHFSIEKIQSVEFKLILEFLINRVAFLVGVAFHLVRY